jgi:hypothetical protein
MADRNSFNHERQPEAAQEGLRSPSAASLAAIRRLQEISQQDQRREDALYEYYVPLRNETEIPWLREIEQTLDRFLYLQAIFGHQVDRILRSELSVIRRLCSDDQSEIHRLEREIQGMLDIRRSVENSLSEERSLHSLQLWREAIVPQTLEVHQRRMMQRNYIHQLELLRFGSRVARFTYLLHVRSALYESLATHNASQGRSRPASVSALLDIKFDQEQIDRISPTCAICTDDFVCGESAKQLPCRHIFHSKCIIQWLHKNSCPLCREPTNG